MAQTNEERETCLSMTGDNHNEWSVFTDDPFWIRRFEKLGLAATKQVGEGYHYKLNADMVLIRRGKRKLSDETIAAMTARLQNASTTAELQPL